MDRFVYSANHRLRPTDPVEAELRVVGAGRVEVDAPHVEDPVEQALLVQSFADPEGAR